MKRDLLVLTSMFMLFVFGVSVVLASVGNSIGHPASAGNSAEAQDKAEQIKLWNEEAQFWHLLFLRCENRCIRGVGEYHDKIWECNYYTHIRENPEELKKCKEKALDEFFECRRRCLVFEEEADKARAKAKEIAQQ